MRFVNHGVIFFRLQRASGINQTSTGFERRQSGSQKARLAGSKLAPNLPDAMSIGFLDCVPKSQSPSKAHPPNTRENFPRKGSAAVPSNSTMGTSRNRSRLKCV